VPVKPLDRAVSNQRGGQIFHNPNHFRQYEGKQKSDTARYITRSWGPQGACDSFMDDEIKFYPDKATFEVLKTVLMKSQVLWDVKAVLYST
jgi:hypothetical protein